MPLSLGGAGAVWLHSDLLDAQCVFAVDVDRIFAPHDESRHIAGGYGPRACPSAHQTEARSFPGIEATPLPASVPTTDRSASMDATAAAWPVPLEAKRR